MIVWINGAFGSGTTTTATRLTGMVDGARMFDPEYIGYLLTKIVPAPSGDFQDMPLWRELTVRTLAGLDRDFPGTWIVPMTLVNPGYRKELHGGVRALGHTVHHAILAVPEPVLRRRIDDDENDRPARQWRQDHVAGALAELPGLSTVEHDTREFDATRPPDEVAADILRWVQRDTGQRGTIQWDTGQRDAGQREAR
jgi:hypothetical protein